MTARTDAGTSLAAAPPELPELRFGARELVVLAFGVMLMVMMALAVSR
jgi:hypothetical protein